MGQDQVRIFDTTLRDGEQAPGFSLRPAEKLQLARQLDALGVDIIEAGFPIASPADAEAVRRIATEIRRPVIACLARCHRADLEKAAWAIKPAAQGRIHTFIATSDLHLQAKLRMTREQCLEAAVDAVRFARQHTVRRAVLGRGRHAQRLRLPLPRRRGGDQGRAPRTINLPDTVGYTHAGRDAATSSRASASACRTPTRWSSARTATTTSGSAVANSLAAVQGGARQVECTVNGIGERAGNAALEEIVMAFHVRRDRMPFTTSVDDRADLPVERDAHAAHRPGACRSTRRSSAATRSRTRPASTRTAC